MRIRIGRALVVGIMLAVIAGGQPVIAQQPAYPGGTWAEVLYRVELSGETDVCTNVEYTYSVNVVKYYGYDNGSTRTYVRQGNVPATLTINVAGRTASGRTRLFGGTSFPARFPNAGTFTITVTGSGVPIIPGSNLQVHIDPASATITAKSCDFELTTLSIWYHLPDGFKPWVGGVTNAVRLRPDSSGQYRATAPLATTAIGAPQGGCVPTFDVQDVDAEISGRVSNDRFVFNVDYSAGTSVAKVVCGSVSGQSREDTFSLDGFHGSWPASPPSGVTVGRIYPHVLHASADVDGVTRVILVSLP